MKRRIHRSACAVLALTALILMGAATQCPWKGLVVEIPDLEANQIEGLQLWRADDETGDSLTDAGRIVFGDCYYLPKGSEVLDYTMLNSEDEPTEVNGSAAVIRGEDESGAVTLHFLFADWSEPPGWIRVTTFNVAGESELSEEAVFL
jgi:hypothetical protein